MNVGCSRRAIEEAAEVLLSQLVPEDVPEQVGLPSAPTPTPKLLLALLALFPHQLEGALSLIDRKSITKLISPLGRAAFQVNVWCGKPGDCGPGQR